MRKKIFLSDGSVYCYSPVSLYLGRKKINIEIEKQNLKDFSEIMNSVGIPFILYFGTLLGAIRDNGFIRHDEDVDLALHIDYFQNFKDSLPLLKNKGFELARIDERGFASVIRNNEYIDLYFFSKYSDNYLGCCGEFAPLNIFSNTTKYEFYGNSYMIPQNYPDILKLYYGDTWNIPIEYKQSLFLQYLAIFRQIIKNLLPKFIVYKILQRKESKKFTIFINKLKKDC